MDYTAYKWENIQGFDGTENDDLPKAGADNISVSVTDGSSHEEIIRKTSKDIIENAFNNKTTETKLFDTLF